MKASSLHLLPVSLASLAFAQATSPLSLSPSVYILPPSAPSLIEVVSSALNTLGYSYIEIDIPVNIDSSDSNSIASTSSDQNTTGPRTGTRTYTVLASQDYGVYRNILREEPNARFILPVHFSSVSGSGFSSIFHSMISYPSSSWLRSLFKQQQQPLHQLQHQTPHKREDQQDNLDNDRLATDNLRAYVDSVRAFFTDTDADAGSPEGGKRGSRLLVLEVPPPDSNSNSNSYAQAEIWVTLCDFLGLGYSTVERLKLWRFPKRSMRLGYTLK